MRRTADYDDHRDHDYDYHDPMFKVEHPLAWMMTVGSIIFGVIGALVAFDVLNIRGADLTEGVSGVQGGDGNAVSNFQDGILLILPGIALAFLALTLHSSEHHFRSEGREKLWGFEHGLAYLGVLGTIALGVVALIVGFDAIDEGYTFRDGIIWGLLSVMGGVLTSAWHMVGHHVPAMAGYGVREDDIRAMVEERVGRALQQAGSSISTTTTTATPQRIEH
jgi:hypothetical protein